MGAKKEFAKNITFSQPHSGEQIVCRIEECAENLGMSCDEKITKAPPASGEEDNSVQVEIQVPKTIPEAIIKIFPLFDNNGLVEGKPYYGITVGLHSLDKEQSISNGTKINMLRINSM